eukprot:1238329-Pleurochrysis_carterae.AAC.1
MAHWGIYIPLPLPRRSTGGLRLSVKHLFAKVLRQALERRPTNALSKAELALSVRLVGNEGRQVLLAPVLQDGGRDRLVR